MGKMGEGGLQCVWCVASSQVERIRRAAGLSRCGDDGHRLDLSMSCSVRSASSTRSPCGTRVVLEDWRASI